MSQRTHQATNRKTDAPAEPEYDEGELPKGWTNARLGELGTYINGRAFKPSEWEKKGLPIIRIQNLNDKGASFNFTTGAIEEKYRVRKLGETMRSNDKSR